MFVIASDGLQRSQYSAERAIAVSLTKS